MKAKKILKVFTITLAAILLLLACVALFWLGPTVKAVAENIGSKALGTPVEMEYLSINPRNGTIHLVGLQVGMHEGFGRSNMVSLGEFYVSADLGSAFSDTVVIHEIRIVSPHFTYEQNSATDNISEMISNIESFAGIDTKAPKEKSEHSEKKETEKTPKEVIIEKLVINDVQMHLANTDDHKLDMQVGLEELAVSLTNGVIQLKNLSVGNPGRLNQPHLFSLDGIRIKLDPDSVYSSMPVIEDIAITKPRIFLELNSDANTAGELMKIADSFAERMPPASNETATEKSEAPAPEPATPPVELHNLVIEDIQLKLLDTVNANAPAEPLIMASINEVSIKLVEGRLRIGAITLPNLPADFCTTNLFHLAGIDITLDPESVFSDQVIINEVRVDSPTVNLERTEITGNIAELQKLAECFVPPSANNTEAAVPQEQPVTETPAAPLPLAEMPVVLEKLIVTNLAVNMVFPVETNGLANAFPMPSLDMLNPLGKRGNVYTNTIEEIQADGRLTLVSFDGLTVEPLKGSIHLTNLQVGNPEGFANKNLVQLDGFHFGFDPDTLQSDVMLIREILIDNPTIAYERKITTDNIKALQTFIEDATTPGGEEEQPEPAPKADEPENTEAEEGGQKVVIEHLLVKSGMVKAKLSALPSAPIPLPKIEMRDIGKDKGGTTPVAAATEIGEEFYNAIIGAVSSTTGFAGDMLKGAGSLSLGALDTATGGVTEGLSDKLLPTGSKEPAPAEPQVKATEEPAKKKPRRTRLPGRRF